MKPRKQKVKTVDEAWIIWDGYNVDTLILVSSTEEFAKHRKKELGAAAANLKIQKMPWSKAFFLWEKGEKQIGKED